jgi:hypothetical protein
MDKFAKLKELIATAETDADKFYNKGNSAAGTRLRKTMQQLKMTAQEVRTGIIKQRQN